MRVRSLGFICLCHFVQIGLAQSIPSMLIGGLIGGTSMLATGSVFISYQSDCFQLYNGINIFFTANRSGAFSFPCQPAAVIKPIELTLYPNPTQGGTFLSASITHHLDQYAWVLVYNSFGQLNQKHLIRLQVLQQGLYLNVTSLSAGIYFIKISSEWLNGTIRLVKI